MKDKYIKYAKETFKDKALELVLNQIEMFYSTEKIEKRKYSIGDDVILTKGTFLHGIREGFGEFDWIVDNGYNTYGIDLVSHGEDSNDFTRFNLTTCILYLRETINYVKDKHKGSKIYLFGSSYGGFDKEVVDLIINN